MAVLDNVTINGASYDIQDTKAQSMVAPIESTSTASAAHAVGSYFIFNGALYRATADIASGGTITPKTNCVAVTMGTEVSELNSAFDYTANALNCKRAYLNANINSSGEIVTINPASSDRVVYFAVEPGDVITATGTFSIYAFYTNEPAIGSVSYNGSRTASGTIGNLPVPNNCHWIAIRSTKNSVKGVDITPKSAIVTDVVKLKKQCDYIGDTLNCKRVYLTAKIDSNGEIVPIGAESTDRLVYFAVKPGVVITATGNFGAHAFYVNEPAFGSVSYNGSRGGSTISSVTVPSGCYWIAIFSNASNVEQITISPANIMRYEMDGAYNALDEKIQESYYSASGDANVDVIQLKRGYYIATNQEVGASVDLTALTSDNSFAYAIVPCSQGNAFTITGASTTTARLWAFINSENKMIEKADANTSGTNLVITAPANASKLIINAKARYNDRRFACKGYSFGRTITEAMKGRVFLGFINSWDTPQIVNYPAFYYSGSGGDYSEKFGIQTVFKPKESVLITNTISNGVHIGWNGASFGLLNSDRIRRSAVRSIVPTDSISLTNFEYYWCLAYTPGTYTNFKDQHNNPIVINDGEVAIVYSNTYGDIICWNKSTIGIASKDYVDGEIEDAITSISQDIEKYVDDWLDAHPEATTSVEDNSITAEKLVSALREKLNDYVYDRTNNIIKIGKNNNPNGSGGRVYIFGTECLFRATTANREIAIGYHSLFRDRTGEYNVSIGTESSDNLSAGQYNVAVGESALRSQRYQEYPSEESEGETLNGNTAIGGQAQYYTYGNYNTSVGFQALRGVTFGATGSGNVAIGAYAGKYNTDENNKLYIDDRDRGSRANEQTKSLIYGEFADDTADQKLSFNALVVMMPYLPTSDPQTAGQLWNDNGTLKISAGT